MRRRAPHVPRELETVVMKCLESERERRYPSARALAEDLARFLAGEPVPARPIGLLGRLRGRARRHAALRVRGEWGTGREVMPRFIPAASPRPAHVRVISATNRDVDCMLATGTFRADLYHRIADWGMTTPPLRRRRADIPNLAAFSLAREGGRHGITVAGISRGGVERLQGYSCRATCAGWSGKWLG